MNFKKKVRFVIGIVLIILITICYIVGGGYLKKGIDTFYDITKPAVKKQELQYMFVSQTRRKLWKIQRDTHMVPRGIR